MLARISPARRATEPNDCKAFQGQEAGNPSCLVRSEAVSSRTVKLRDTIRDSKSGRITQATRSETSRRWCERICTVIATCAPAGPFGLSVSSGIGSCSFRWRFAAFAPAVRPLTAFFLPRLPVLLRGFAVALCYPVNAYISFDVVLLCWGPTPIADRQGAPNLRLGRLRRQWRRE